MAHLITLHTAGQNQEILFNLDTMVSAEKNENYTAINTRWGYQNVRESLEEIMAKSREYNIDNGVEKRNETALGVRKR